MRVLHLQCLRDLPDVPREIAGIRAAAGLADGELTTIRPFDAPVSPTLLDDAQGIVIGGSGWSAFHDIPFYEEFLALLTEARRRRTPTFGICFGAQTLARLHDGVVVRDEAHAEYGTTDIDLDPAAADDPLFSSMPKRFAAQSWHHDRIIELPPGAAALAWSRSGVLQAFAFPGEPLYAVQFHPERTAAASRELFPIRCAKKPEWRDALLSGLRESPEATHLLKRFIDRFVRP